MEILTILTNIFDDTIRMSSKKKYLQRRKMKKMSIMMMKLKKQ